MEEKSKKGPMFPETKITRIISIPLDYISIKYSISYIPQTEEQFYCQ